MTAPIVDFYALCLLILAILGWWQDQKQLFLDGVYYDDVIAAGSELFVQIV